MQKNYYLILGITSDANLDEIKAAFRRRALELHPDQSGLESGPFLEVQEAYGVLSDPGRRRDYDRRGEAIARHRPWGPSAEPLVRKRTPAEPFATRGFRDVSLTESFSCHQVEVVISPEQAASGGTVSVGIPARATCSACAGRGAVGFYECWRCEGRGALTLEYPFEVAHPPGVPDGYALRLPLSRFGIENFYLIVLFRVSGETREVG